MMRKINYLYIEYIFTVYKECCLVCMSKKEGTTKKTMKRKIGEKKVVKKTPVERSRIRTGIRTRTRTRTKTNETKTSKTRQRRISKRPKNKTLKITVDDYKKILLHYGKDIPMKDGYTDLPKLTQTAHSILVKKLCGCIKKVEKYSKLPERSIIPICKNTIFEKRGLRNYRFTCKSKRKLIPKKGTNITLSKTRKVLDM